MIQFFSHSLPLQQIVLFYFVAILVGMGKTGVQGAGLFAVPLLATVFGGKESTGILLPLLCIADVFGVIYYHRHGSWHHLKQLLPWAIAGIILGTFIGGMINDNIFRILMAGGIVLSILLMIWFERVQNKNVPESKGFANATGAIGGFTSMIGNVAGPLMAVYFLAIRLPKNVFIGTSAWFFLVINFLKVPFHVLGWKTITMNTIVMDVSALPAILLGAWLGVVIVRQLSEKTYRWFIVAMTLVAAVVMVL